MRINSASSAVWMGMLVGRTRSFCVRGSWITTHRPGRVAGGWAAVWVCVHTVGKSKQNPLENVAVALGIFPGAAQALSALNGRMGEPLWKERER